MKQRIVSYDILRVLACLMVVFMHSPMPSEKAISIFNFGISYFTSPCVPMFFAISGALILPVIAPPQPVICVLEETTGESDCANFVLDGGLFVTEREVYGRECYG